LKKDISMAEQFLGQHLKLSQEQILAPQQIISLEMLVAPLLELQEKLSRELELNPVIEMEPGFNEEQIGDPIADATQAAENQEPTTGGDDDRELAELIKLGDSWHDYLPSTAGKYDADAEKRRDFMFNSQIEQPSLQDDLLEQLRMSEITEKKRIIIEYIIGNIDDTGYFRGHMEEIEAALKISHTQVEDAFKLIHTFTPLGVGARSIKENLLIQLRHKKGKNHKLHELVENHLDELGRNKLPLIAKKMNISVDDVAALQEQLQTLNPFPGSAIAASQPSFVVPDLEIERSPEGQFILSPDDNVPRLTISQTYLDLLDNPETTKETRDYIREKLLNGKMLMRSLDQRQSTLRRIATIILDTQYDFFHQGVESLRPMTMRAVADKLGLHETTISRAIASKYLKTPNGLFEFKFFFSGGYQTSEGDEVSSRSVKEIIRDMIEDEDTAKPLSDNKLSAMLEKKGLKVARRTVAKYREALGIPATSLRRQYQ
jgi:RNA polymerase sigma-54 factor